MDYLMFNVGECDDALRDRDLVLIRNARTREERDEKLCDALAKHYGSRATAMAEVVNGGWKAMVRGPHLELPFTLHRMVRDIIVCEEE